MIVVALDELKGGTARHRELRQLVVITVEIGERRAMPEIQAGESVEPTVQSGKSGARRDIEVRHPVVQAGQGLQVGATGKLQSRDRIGGQIEIGQPRTPAQSGPVTDPQTARPQFGNPCKIKIIDQFRRIILVGDNGGSDLFVQDGIGHVHHGDFPHAEERGRQSTGHRGPIQVEHLADIVKGPRHKVG